MNQYYSIVALMFLCSKLTVYVTYHYVPPQARGIDVQQVSLVINYDLPTNRENYIHR